MSPWRHLVGGSKCPRPPVSWSVDKLLLTDKHDSISTNCTVVVYVVGTSLVTLMPRLILLRLRTH